MWFFPICRNYEDGIYHESNSVEQNQNEDYTSINASDYYKNYFKEKSLNFEGESTTFTDADSYKDLITQKIQMLIIMLDGVKTILVTLQ